MTQSPYEASRRGGLSLADRLALDRTELANERTLLAYLRTALALAVVGASCLQFLDRLIFHAAGWAFLAAGGVTAAAGVRRFLAVRRRLAGIAAVGRDDAQVS